MKLASEKGAALSDSVPVLDLPRFLTREHHRIHLVGVAGSGMSGLAALLIELGHVVSGSDKVSTMETDRLQRLGLRFDEQHLPEHAGATELVVFSSAIKTNNPVLVRARDLAKPIARRAEALAALMRAKRGIVVAGMHGKTTTSAMTAHVLREGGLHPSHYVGAEIPILGTNAHWDARGKWFVAEGDESDGTLALFNPEHTLVLNVEEEHLDFYADLAAIEKVFARLIEQTNGTVFYNIDDASTARLCATRKKRISFGFSDTADYRGADVDLHAFHSNFCVYSRGEKLGELVLNVPGQHNVHNAIGVVALATELGIAFDKIANSLRRFEHARRRFEIKYASERFLLVDDYAHHPTEIRATLKTARAVGRKRVLTMFQPHRYSRTKALCKEFAGAFENADRIVVTDVYPASEASIPGVSGQTIVDEIVRHGHRGANYQPQFERVHWDIGNALDVGDLVLSLGAGNIHEQLSILAADLVIAEQLKAIVGETGKVRLYEPLSKHTTLRVGGPAQFWVEPQTEKAFAELIRFCRDENLPLFVMGRGSNLLIRDGGLRGVMGAQTFENVVRVRYLDATGEAHTKTRDELEVHYRNFPLLEKNFAVSAVFRGSPAPLEEIMRKLEASQEKRRTSQPAAKSAGCIFKNPDSSPAGKLIDELGLKNLQVGKARVSEVHGNFIVNDGGATAAEMLELIDRIKATARAKRGIELETEVQIVGEPA